MPSPERVRAFIARVESRDFLVAMEDFYHANATAQENSHPPRIGLPALLTHERRSLERSPETRVRKVERLAVEGDTVFINWVFEMGGKVLDKIVVQTWRGDRIASDQFYYDPEQMK